MSIKKAKGMNAANTVRDSEEKGMTNRTVANCIGATKAI